MFFVNKKKISKLNFSKVYEIFCTIIKYRLKCKKFLKVLVIVQNKPLNFEL